MNIMVIAAHPNLRKSKWNKALMNELKNHPDVLIRDLYQEYQNWSIDVEKEQRLLLEYDRIVFQFPFYWFSCPPLLKKWFDDVLTYGWAHGPGGENLKGKEFMIATTTGGAEEEYRVGGRNMFTVKEYLGRLRVLLSDVTARFFRLLHPTILMTISSKPKRSDMQSMFYHLRVKLADYEEKEIRTTEKTVEVFSTV